MSGKKVLIDGHRGNLDFVPENTMDSFRSAVELEVDAVEMDIHLSSDRTGAGKALRGAESDGHGALGLQRG